MLWEAQFGDFVNGAQIVIDQFLVAGLSKWGQTSRLTLLLPHGYEGNGPEHSSAKLERFLQLAAQENIRVANCTTAAQYFHLLRRQALDATARPLVVMTPKGLLRLKQAASTLADLSEGRFEPVLDDPGADRECGDEARAHLRQALLRHRGPRGARPTRRPSPSPGSSSSIPFPVEPAAALTASYPNLRELVWAQEEPQNMGAWRTIRHRLEAAAPDGVPVALRRPAVAREPERGLPDRAPRRAGPDRPRGAGPQRRSRLELRLAAGRQNGSRDPRAVRARGEHHLPALRGRQPAPEVESAVGEPDRTGGADARHGGMFAHAAAVPRL